MLSIQVPSQAPTAYPSPLSSLQFASAADSCDPMFVHDVAPHASSYEPVSPCTAAITKAAAEALSSSSHSDIYDPASSTSSSGQRTPSFYAHPHDITPPHQPMIHNDAFLPAFFEYDQHQYQLATNPELRKQSRKFSGSMAAAATALRGLSTADRLDADHTGPAASLSGADIDPSNQAELRRQIHIQSEQKRRALIKDGFEELRVLLPGCHGKKVSKAVLLARTTAYLQQVQQHNAQLQSEVERLAAENARLRAAAGHAASPRRSAIDAPMPAML